MKLESAKDQDELRIFFTNAKIENPHKTYETEGAYLWYSKVNVELRSRVKLISGVFNVPVSSQWNKSGHIYPVQVAQYGLSCFSKWKSSGSGRTRSQNNINDVRQWNLRGTEAGSTVMQTQDGFDFNLKGRHLQLVADFTAGCIKLFQPLCIPLNRPQSTCIQLDRPANLLELCDKHGHLDDYEA